MPTSTPIPLPSFTSSAREALQARVEETALASQPIGYGVRAMVRLVGACSFLGLGLWGFLRGFGDPYHKAVVLDALGWAALLGFPLALVFLRFWARERHFAGVHLGTAGAFLLPEGLVELKNSGVTFRSRTAVRRFWRWETVDSDGRWMFDHLSAAFRDGQVWTAPLEGRGFLELRSALRRSPSEPRLEVLLGSLPVSPEPVLPPMARLPLRPCLVILLLLFPCLVWFRNGLSDDAAYRRALGDPNPHVWAFYASRTRKHQGDALRREKAADEAWRKPFAPSPEAAR